MTDHGGAASPRTEAAVWLIERGQSMGHVPTVWWGWDRATGLSNWTEDASEAFRFPSRAAADIEIERRSGLPIPSHGGPLGSRFGVATEHRFAASPRTEAGKNVLATLARIWDLTWEVGRPINGVTRDEFLALRSQDIVSIEDQAIALAEAAQEAPAPEGLRAILEATDWPRVRCAKCGSELLGRGWLEHHDDGSHSFYPSGAIEAEALRLADPLLDRAYAAGVAAQEAPAPEGLRVLDALEDRLSRHGAHSGAICIECGDDLRPWKTAMRDEIAAQRRALAATPPTPAEPPLAERNARAIETLRRFRAGDAVEQAETLAALLRAEARPPEGLDTDRLGRAIHAANDHKGPYCLFDDTEAAKDIVAEYARLSAGGATKP